MYERVKNNEERTNNFVETANRALHAAFDADHPTIWKFIDKLRSVQQGNDKKYYEFSRWEEPAKKREKYQSIDAKIRKIVSQIEKCTVSGYLVGIAAVFMS